MKPLTIGLLLENQRFRAQLDGALQEVPVRVILDQGGFESLAAIRDKLQYLQPDVLMVDLGEQPEDRLAFIRSVRTMNRAPAVVVCHNANDAKVILQVMRAGAAEFLTLPLEEGALLAALERISALLPGRDAGTDAGGRVLAFLSVKGGAGATTLACNVAVALGKEQGSDVLLADMDLDTGNVAFAMKAPGPYSVADACRNLSRLDEHYWRGLVSNGLPGLHVLTAPAEPSSADPPQGVELRQVLNFARGLYRYSVVDLGRGLNRVTLSVIEDADEVFLVTTAELPGVHVAQRSLQLLQRLGYRMERVRLTLNRSSRHDPVASEDIQRNLKTPVFWRFPLDAEGVHEFYVKGGVLPPKSDLGKSVRQFAAKITGQPAPKRSRSILGL